MKRTTVQSVLLACTLLSACSKAPKIQLSPDEKPMVAGSRVRANTTINTETFRCFDKAVAQKHLPIMNIAIGNIADYTGKTTDSEGAVITKGGSLMLFSALGLMPESVRLHDRFDTSVTDLEMTYVNARQLGDGQTHDVKGETVPWLPYYGGSIQKSDYTILGGITEVNFNLGSGGYSAQVNQIGPKSRSFTMSVAADLRLVKTDTLVVVSTASFQKQFTGYEVGANLFSFFDVFNDKQLFDVYAGNIAQEPMQLGVRAILEEAALELMSDVTNVDYVPCAFPKLVYADQLSAENKSSSAQPEEASVAPVLSKPSANTAATGPALRVVATAGHNNAASAAKPTSVKPKSAPLVATDVATNTLDKASPALISDTATPATGAATTGVPAETSIVALGQVAKAAPAVSSTSSATKTGMIMVGSFKMESGARNAGSRISSIGLTPTVRSHQTDAGTIWSVRVFTSRSPAILKKIRSLGFPDAYFLK